MKASSFCTKLLKSRNYYCGRPSEAVMNLRVTTYLIQQPRRHANAKDLQSGSVHQS
jgi:hypothetical protein